MLNWKKPLKFAPVLFSLLALTACAIDLPQVSTADVGGGVTKPLGATTLTNADQQVVAMNGTFDRNAAVALREVVGAPIEAFRQSAAAKERVSLHQAMDSGTEGERADKMATSLTDPTPGPVLGFQCTLPEGTADDTAIQYVEALRKKVPAGYYPFLVEENNKKAVAVQKGNDQYDTLRLMGTYGGPSTDAIIDRLKLWNNVDPLHVVAATHDSVTARLDGPAKNPDTLGQEVQKFAPGDGSASASDFANDIRSSGTIFLWWD